MILFLDMDEQTYLAERLLLEASHPSGIVFGNAVSGREEVIICDQPERAVIAAGEKPTARVILVVNDKYAMDPDAVLEYAHQGIYKISSKGDTEELVVKAEKAFHEKKNLSGYVKQVEPEVSFKAGQRMQVGDLKNDFLIGTSESLRLPLHLMSKYVHYKEDVLIVGENGSGKDVAAEVFLANCKEKHQEKVNVAEFSDELLASELFGHKKGAFTGAFADKEGLIAKYRGGILFLDEIGECSLAAQAILLRYLQNREYRRVGATETERSDTRLLMATNANLPRLVDEGKMREDFYFRICGLMVRIPPLRDRAEDIPFLVEERVRRLNKTTGVDRAIDKPVMDALIRQPWPGNIRQLLSFVTTLHAVESTGIIGEETLHLCAGEFNARGLSFGRPSPPPAIQAGSDLEVKRKAVHETVEKFGLRAAASGDDGFKGDQEAGRDESLSSWLTR